jgi:RNA polymerase sigma factor (sigma-70 family)
MAQSGSIIARKSLLEQFYETAKKQIDRMARAKRLQAHDVADAEQEVVFAIDEAIRKYALHQPITRVKCRFPSYLHAVVECRFKNWFKSHCRNQKRFHPSNEVKSALEYDAIRLIEQRTGTPEPSKEVEDKEFQEHWSQAVGLLSPELRTLYASLLIGKPKRVIADDLKISIRTLQLWKNKMLIELRCRLTD